MTQRQHIGVIVNDLATLSPSQTTWSLVRGFLQRGCRVSLLPAWQLGTDMSGDVIGGAVSADTHDFASTMPRVQQIVRLRSLDLLVVRTNPGREERPGATEHTLVLLARLERQGIPIVNSPMGLWRASSKLYLTEFDPALRPATLVTRDLAAVRRFVTEIGGPCVLKPVTGTRGRDVFFVDGPTSPNLAQIVDVIARDGPVMVQDYLPEATAGDIRVVILDGSPLAVGGAVCAVGRQPGPGEFRSNVHVGGTPIRASLTDRQLQVARSVGVKLKRDGISLAGLDLIGHRVVEINVFSTGGFQDAEAFTGAAFTEAVIDWLAARIVG